MSLEEREKKKKNKKKAHSNLKTYPISLIITL